MKKTNELIENAEQYLKDWKYAHCTIQNYRCEWKRFACYCERIGVSRPDMSIAEEYLVGVRATEGKSDSCFDNANRAILILFDIESGAKPPARYCTKSKARLPKCFLNQYEAYIKAQNAKGLKTSTIKGKACMARHFLVWLEDTGIESADAINAGHVYGYIACNTWRAPQSRTGVLYFLRDFLRYLCDSHGAAQSIGRLFPTILANKECALPSAYSPYEVAKIIDSIRDDGECPRRNRAIVLLAAMHGLRIGDIKKLRFDDIDWPLKRLNIVQGKTGARLIVPLHDECVLAIIDYYIVSLI